MNILSSVAVVLFLDPADNMRDILSQITCKEMSTSKRMGYVNNFTKVLCIHFKRELFWKLGFLSDVV